MPKVEYNVKKWRRTGTEVGDALCEVLDDGKRARNDLSFESPYAKPGHPFHALYLHAWVYEDLRLALMDAKPSYRMQQESICTS